MESNGKSVDLEGDPVDVPDRPDRVGPAGHQRPARLLPAASTRAPRSSRATSSGSADPTTTSADHHDLLMANCFAQTEALAFGKTARRSRPRACPPRRCPTARSRATARRTRSSPRADAARARPAHRGLRAQGLHPGRGLEHQLLRPVGRRAGQGARQPDRPRARRRPSRPDLDHDSSTNALIRRYRAERGPRRRQPHGVSPRTPTKARSRRRRRSTTRRARSPAAGQLGLDAGAAELGADLGAHLLAGGERDRQVERRHASPSAGPADRSRISIHSLLGVPDGPRARSARGRSRRRARG